MKIIKLTLAACLFIAFIVIQNDYAGEKCKNKFSIDYVGLWSEYYDACNSEMKTTFTYSATDPGAYLVVWAQVDNTPYSVQYYPGQLCNDIYPCSGSVIDWTHCAELDSHRLMMDVQPVIGDYPGFNTHVLTAEYYADDPD
jgi:hypothetical protein